MKVKYPLLFLALCEAICVAFILWPTSCLWANVVGCEMAIECIVTALVLLVRDNL